MTGAITTQRYYTIRVEPPNALTRWANRHIFDTSPAVMQIHLMNPPSSRGAKDPDLCGSSAAALHRSPAGSPDDIDNVIMEKIASGSLDKMIRLAFSDPDQELWRYRIIVGSREYDGNDIIEMAGSIDLSIDAATTEWLQSAVSVWQTEEHVGDGGFSESSDT